MGKVDYKTVLDEAWQQHLAPREPDAPTVISTFAGCGGSSLGYSMAGFRELLAVEWDDNAVETFKLNFPDVPVYHGDITKLSVEKCCEMAGVQPGELDILDGSPPCQGFSTAGKRNMDDDRNQLFREFARLLRGIKPKVFIMENVSGMVKGKMKLVFAECLRELKASGYLVKVWLLNAMYFNVPQSRKRMIFVGVRENLNAEPRCPLAESIPITVMDAIGYLPKGEQGGHQPQVIEAWHKSKPGQSLREAVSDVGSMQSVRLDPHQPSKTQVKSHRHWHFLVPRKLTDAEAGILSSYPLEFRWIGSKQNRTERIGNSVPPLFMRAIAGHIRATILERMTELGCKCEVQ